ncbi:MAG: flagellar biosynthesis protein FlhF [Burkholderiaceae bacterium]|nr:flagellar biosynthesis protein FlhF [Burkholderiaceae bacterium]
MNVKRFTARTSRDALALVRQALGEDAVVLSTRPCADGVEVVAMAPESMAQIERMASDATPAEAPAVTAPAAQRPVAGRPGPGRPGVARTQLAARAEAQAGPETATIDDDVERLSMSTLSFQDYVRERMLKRRQVALQAESAAARAAAPVVETAPGPLASRMADVPAARVAPSASHAPTRSAQPIPGHAPVLASLHSDAAAMYVGTTPVLHEPPVLREEVRTVADLRDRSRAAQPPVAQAHLALDAGTARRDQQDMMSELRSMKGMIEERFGALAFMEKLQRQPAQARLTQKLLDCGFSPALIRKLAEGMGTEVTDEMAWSASVLERNLLSADREPALEDQGGVYALVGATGVGKTTTTAKLAAAFATRYGAAHLGLITLDAYRVGAHEQLRAYGRILGVPVHTAHDRASLEDLLELLAGKKMVLIDTAGMAQRDTRTRELLDMLSHRSIHKLLVVNSAAQGETIEDVLIAYQASTCRGVVLSKMDEAVKLGPALDALIRHKLTVLGVANGQRVPEDWHRLSSHALIHRALRPTVGSAYRMDSSEVNLIFAAPQNQSHPLSQIAVHDAMAAHA